MIDKIILGTVQMGLPYGINNFVGQLSENDSHVILAEAHESGVKTLDTAIAYGTAHRVIGQFHRLNPSSRFNVITKLSDDCTYDVFDKSIENALKDLHVDRLEAIMFHSYQGYRRYRGRIQELAYLKKNNSVGLIGVSLYTNHELQDVIGDNAIDLVQVPFNLLDNVSVRGRLLQKARDNGKKIHTRSAFLQGLFFKSLDERNAVSDLLRPQLELLHNIADKENITISDLALSYCLCQETIDNVIIGVDSVSQLKNNLLSASVKISERIIKEINEIITPNLDLLNPSLWPQKLC